MNISQMQFHIVNDPFRKFHLVFNADAIFIIYFIFSDTESRTHSLSVLINFVQKIQTKILFSKQYCCKHVKILYISLIFDDSFTM